MQLIKTAEKYKYKMHLIKTAGNINKYEMHLMKTPGNINIK